MLRSRQQSQLERWLKKVKLKWKEADDDREMNGMLLWSQWQLEERTHIWRPFVPRRRQCAPSSTRGRRDIWAACRVALWWLELVPPTPPTRFEDYPARLSWLADGAGRSLGRLDTTWGQQADYRNVKHTWRLPSLPSRLWRCCRAECFVPHAPTLAFAVQLKSGDKKSYLWCWFSLIN